MFAVVFEVQPKPECRDTYLDLAKHLKPLLEQTDGFIDNERFASEQTQGRVLSLSTWRDEKALVRWRTHAEHHRVQERGRFQVFADYHLRVGEIMSDTRDGAVSGKRSDTTEAGRAKALTITEFTLSDGEARTVSASVGLTQGAAGLVDSEAFASIYTPGKSLLLASWSDERAARAFAPRADQTAKDFRHRRITVIRDYGLRDRREAPQYFAAVE
jgi:heme-degrading monooxygenase HmoA